MYRTWVLHVRYNLISSLLGPVLRPVRIHYASLPRAPERAPASPKAAGPALQPSRAKLTVTQ